MNSPGRPESEHRSAPHAGSRRKAGPLCARWRAAALLALQWRLLLLWLAGLALPLLLAVLPLWIALAGVLDRAPLAVRIVEGLDVTVLVEALGALGPRGWSPASGLGGVLALLLLMPWLGGTVIAAGRAAVAGRPPLALGALLRGGLAEYGLMARLWLWALVPIGAVLAVGAGLVNWSDEHALTMLLEADADRLKLAALALAALLFFVAHATLDAARAQLVLEPRRRSVVAAWLRGTRALVREPGRLALLALLTLAGVAAAALLGWLRTQVAPVGTVSFGVALLLGQALVAALAWQRCARVLGLVLAGRAAAASNPT